MTLLFNTQQRSWPRGLICLLLGLIQAQAGASGATLPPAWLNEIVAASANGLSDEDGEHVDWIELYNPRLADLNLADWSLTDDAEDLAKWKFPATTLASGGYLLVYASGKDRRTSGAPLHANFQLRADGEFLALVQPDGTIVSSFSPTFPPQRVDVSYGRVSGTDTNGFLATSTPGQPNVAGTAVFVADTKFSHDRGFYEAGFNLVITCATPGATIYYTTNGSVPSATQGRAYGGPIPIARTTTLRARAELPGARPSDVDTQTYLFLRDVVDQSPTGAPPPGWPASWGNNHVDYGMDPDIVRRVPWSGTISNDLRALPTLSVVMRLEDLFSADTGIYANAEMDGRAWERPVSLELIFPDGQQGFQLDAGLRIRGGFSRWPQNPKHSLRVLCREEYGTSRLRYPLFGATGAAEFDRFDLRTSQDNSYAFQGEERGTFLNDPFVRDTLLATGQPAERGDWYHLYLNGQYWGLYNTCERPEANFAAAYFGGAPEDYDVLKPDPQFNYEMKVTDGDDGAWHRLWQAATEGFANNTAYFRVQGRNPDGTLHAGYENLLEVTNLVDYLLTIIYSGDYDGPIYGDLNTGFLNNYYAFRSRNNTSGFRFITHDAELSLENLDENRAGTSTRGSPSRGDGPEQNNPHYLATRLRANAEFKMLFADRVQKHFFNHGPMTIESASARYGARTNELHRAITGESARWGDAQRPSDPITRSDWLDAVEAMFSDYFPQRTDIVLDQLRAENLFPSVRAAQITPAGGQVEFGSFVALTHANASGQIYYTVDGTDPRAIGGGLSPAALSYDAPIPIQGSVALRVRVRNNSVWSPLTEAVYIPAQDLGGLRITEIMYHPPSDGVTDGDEWEFLELKNTGSSTLDVGGMIFTGITFTFEPGRLLTSGAFLVLGRNLQALSAKYPGLQVAGVYSGKLDNAGEAITLHTALGAEVLSVRYEDRAPWPAAADGLGFSIVPVNPTLPGDANDGTRWRASRVAGGSPGADDTGTAVPAIRLNEILSHTDLPQLDSVELLNPTGNAVDLTGWYLTDDPAVPRKFRIPAGQQTIAAGGYLVFNEAAFNAGNSGFALDSTGDALYLFSGSAVGTNLTGYSHGVKFGAAANGVSFGRYTNSVGEEQFPAQVALSLGVANGAPRVGPAVISEIHYHPATNHYEFVEVQNVSGSPLNLYDAAHPANTWRCAGLSFSFPAGVTLPAGGLLIIAGTDPATFRTKYGVPSGVPIFGPFLAKLQDGGERLELQRPDTPNTNGVVPYITVDEVRYGDRSPWPVVADGEGSSLQRLVLGAYGNEPTNWFASGFTPGTANRPTLGPPITEQPQSQTAAPGDTVTFHVTALGDSLAYQWRFNDTNLPGETSDTLTLTDVAPAQAGAYRVVVNGSAGSVTSVVATLSIQCTFSLTPSLTVFAAAGGVGQVDVLTSPGCGWTVAGLPEWVTLQSNASDSGAGTVSYAVSPYTGTRLRSASLLISSRVHLIVQSPPDSSRPSVKFSSPTANARLTNASILLAGTASDNVALARVEYDPGSGVFQAAHGKTTWDAQVALVPGTNTLRVRSVDYSGNVSATNSRSVVRVVTTPLSLTSTGRGTVAGAASGDLLEIGRSYTLIATPAAGSVFSNWTGGVSGSAPTLTFLMRSNLAITANFVTNPFVSVRGIFSGLFREPLGVQHGSSGFFTFTLAERGSYTAALVAAGKKLSASGRLALDGSATNTLLRPGTNALVVTWNVALDGSDSIRGQVRGDGWQAELLGNRAIFSASLLSCPQVGQYTLLLPGTSGVASVPGGDGYATVSVDANGLVKWTGYLADHTKAVQRVSLSKHLDWPLYAPLSGRNGSVLGWIQFTNAPLNDLEGQVHWSRPPSISPLYPAGFDVSLESSGSRYVRPIATDQHVLDLEQARLEFTGGGLSEPWTNRVAFGPGSRATNLGPHTLRLSLKTANGLFQGTLTPTGLAQHITFRGAVQQKATNASGYFLDSSLSGRVRVSRAP